MNMFMCKYGNVEYYSDEMYGCCGVRIISGVKFEIPPINRRWGSPEIPGYREKLYKEFNKFLRSGAYEYHDDENKLIMSDAVNGEKGLKFPSIYEMCKTTRWRMGKPTYNRNSGRKVVMFETDLYQAKSDEARNTRS